VHYPPLTVGAWMSSSLLHSSFSLDMPWVAGAFDIDERPLRQFPHQRHDPRTVRSTASTLVNANTAGSVPWVPPTIKATSAMAVFEGCGRP
jgi:hypothetical protein